MKLFRSADDLLPLAEQLAEARGALVAEVRHSADLQRRLDLWMEAFVRVERRCHGLETARDQAIATLAQTRADLQEATARLLYLERETTDLERSRDELSEMADCLRDDLRKAKERKRS